MPRICVDAEIDVSDIDSDDMLKVLENRGYTVVKDAKSPKTKHVTTESGFELDADALYEAYGADPQEFDRLIREFFWEKLGRLA